MPVACLGDLLIAAEAADNSLSLAHTLARAGSLGCRSLDLSDRNSNLLPAYYQGLRLWRRNVLTPIRCLATCAVFRTFPTCVPSVSAHRYHRVAELVAMPAQSSAHDQQRL